MKRCYIFDIDGTIANGDHRIHHIKKSPKDWDTYFSLCHLDEPIPHMVELAQILNHTQDIIAHIVYVSGRSASTMQATLDWLDKHDLPKGPLFMRPVGNHTDDDKLKIELLAEVRSLGYEPIMVFDDRDRVVKAWRDAGVPCAQVAPGDF